VKVTAKVVGGVLVVGFREPVTGQRDRLASEMPAYVVEGERDAAEILLLAALDRRELRRGGRARSGGPSRWVRRAGAAMLRR
jgi:hypothetical protein